MSVLPPFDLVRPVDLGGVLEALSADHVPYAGGTELLLAMRAGLLRPSALVDIKRVPELSIVEERDGRVFIGGAATHHAVSKSAVVGGLLPSLGDVLNRVGNPRVRSVGTLGGNLCFGEPKSDVATILIALGAEVEVRSVEGSRVLPVADFVVGPYTTVLEENEILISISVPVVPGRRVVYEKFQTMERPTVGVAAVAEPDGSRHVVVGAVGGRPEQFEVEAGVTSGSDIAATLEVIPDLTGGERYKRHVASVVVARSLGRLEVAA